MSKRKIGISNQLKLDIFWEYYKNGKSLVLTKRAIFILYKRDESFRNLANGTILRLIKRMTEHSKLLKNQPPGRSRSVLINKNIDRAETVKTENYLKMMRSGFIPKLRRKKIFNDVVFQQDGAPPHYSREAIAWLTKQFTEERLISRNSTFKWPAYSPDLNPCDYYLWGYLKSKVYSPYPQDIDELKNNIRREFKKISSDTITSVIENFSSRAQMVLSKRGGWIEHILNY
jgi:hypothetical protein